MWLLKSSSVQNGAGTESAVFVSVSHQKPTTWKLAEQRWCDLDEEVSPFPEPTPLSPKNTPSSDSLRLSTSQQDLSVQTKPVPDPPDRQQSSHSKQSHDGKTTTLQSLTKITRPSLHSWQEDASSAGCSEVRRQEARKGREQEEPQTRAVNIQFLTNKMKESDCRHSLQKEDESKEEVVEDKVVEEAQASFRGDGGAATGGGGGGRGGLQSCPMCLIVFPAG